MKNRNELWRFHYSNPFCVVEMEWLEHQNFSREQDRNQRESPDDRYG